MGIHEHTYNDKHRDAYAEPDPRRPTGTEKLRLVQTSDQFLSPDARALHLVGSGEKWPTKCCADGCGELIGPHNAFVDDAAERRKYREVRRGRLANGDWVWLKACGGRL